MNANPKRTVRLFCLFFFFFLLTSPSILGEESHGEDVHDEDSPEEEEESPEEDYNYFYALDPDSPVVEYAVPDNGDIWASHDFLWQPEPGLYRLVEFYAPWCPHCLHFKDQYIALAKSLKDLAKNHHINLEVYAVSCMHHRPICHEYDVHGYPKIKLFLAGETNNGTLIAHNEMHPFRLLKMMGVEFDADLEDEPDHLIAKVTSSSPGARGAASGDQFFLPRKKKEIYNDAYLSFQFAMKNGIFTSKGALTNTTKQHFEDFLLLIQATTPPAFRLLDLVNDIVSSIQRKELHHEEDLVRIVDQHPTKKKSWSRSCTRDVPGMGYTCGLWELFHIMSVGFVEYNYLVFGDDYVYYRPSETAETLRDFIQHFFGCEVCQAHFAEAFDSCAYDRCNRLVAEVGSVQEWVEFPIWLFEFHNGVNIRLMKEKAEREGRVPTKEDEIAVHWPSRQDCPMCWRQNGTFDPHNIYMFLRLTYWPHDATADTMRRKLLQSELHHGGGRISIVNWVLGGLLIALVAMLAVSYYKKHSRLDRSKKIP